MGDETKGRAVISMKTDLQVVFIRRHVVLYGWRLRWEIKKSRWVFNVDVRRASLLPVFSFAFRGQRIDRKHWRKRSENVFDTDSSIVSKKAVERVDYARFVFPLGSSYLEQLICEPLEPTFFFILFKSITIEN